MVDQGYLHAMLLSSATLNLAGKRHEQYAGLSQMRFLDQCSDDLDSIIAELLDQVRRERLRVFTRDRLVINLTGDAQGLDAARVALKELIDALPEGEQGSTLASGELGRDWVGLALSSEVSFVARSATVPGMLDPVAPKLAVLAQIMSDGYFYEEIRVKGGAYGGFCTYRPMSGTFSLGSYRDPNLAKTIDVFDGMIEAAKGAGVLTHATIQKAIIGCVGSFDGILDPCKKGQAALSRDLIGLTDEDRKRYRDALLAVDLDGVLNGALPVLEKAMKTAATAVVSSREKIEEANSILPMEFEIQPFESPR